MTFWRVTYLNDNGWAIAAETFEGTRSEAECFARLTHPVGQAGRYRIERAEGRA